MENLLSVDQASRLNAALKAMGSLKVNTADTQAYEVLREDVGESLPMNNRSCEHPYMVPDKARHR